MQKWISALARHNASMKKTKSEIALLTIFALLTAMLPTATNAWQLGGKSTQSVGYYGVEAGQAAFGSVPSSYWFAAISAFTDNSANAVWHLISVTIGSTNTIHVEYSDANHVIQPTDICTSGITTGTYYTDKIYARSNSLGVFKYTTTGCSTTFTSPAECASTCAPQIDSGGSVDMMESTDTTSSDFSNQKAYVDFYNPSLNYFFTTDSGGLTTSSTAYAYGAGPSLPSSIGNAAGCGPTPGHYIIEVIVSSGYTQSTSGTLKSC